MTKTEKSIQELEKALAVLEERLDNVRKTTETMGEIDRRLSWLEENFKDLKKDREQKDGRRWTIVVLILSCLLTLLAQAILSYLKTNK